VVATQNNIKNNQIESQISVLHTNDEGQLVKANLLIANILAQPLVGLCVHFSTLLKSGGQLVLSGILHKQVEMILAAYGDYLNMIRIL
jgi:ribosomal protein L11 methyltransferase